MAGCGRAAGLFVPGSPGECGRGCSNLHRAAVERCDPDLTGRVFLRFTRRLLKHGFGGPKLSNGFKKPKVMCNKYVK